MEAVAAQLHPQPDLGPGVHDGVGHQLVGDQHRALGHVLAGQGQLPVLAQLADEPPGGCRCRRGRRQARLVTQVGRPGQGLLQGLLDVGVQPQEARHLHPVEHLGDLRARAAQQEAGRRPAARRVAGDRREHRGADRVHPLHAGELADHREGLLAELLEQHVPDARDGEEVDPAAERHDDAAVSGGTLDLHARPRQRSRLAPGHGQGTSANPARPSASCRELDSVTFEQS
jgi:hypothetical protein